MDPELFFSLGVWSVMTVFMKTWPIREKIWEKKGQNMGAKFDQFKVKHRGTNFNGYKTSYDIDSYYCRLGILLRNNLTER